MKKILLVITITFLTKSYLFAQTILNGGFEFNNATTDRINLGTIAFDSCIDSCKSFGSNANLDLITSDTYCNSSAIEGNWYVALTGGGTDAFSMQLDTNLVTGIDYTISFYDRYCIPYIGWGGQASAIDIGLSLINNVFGNSIYTTTSLPTSNWTIKTFTFTAPNDGQYITVKLTSGGLYNTWVQVDGFTFGTGSVGLNDTFINNFDNIFYPNPTTDFIFLREGNKIRSLRIYDIYGMLVLTNNQLNNQNTEEKINLTGLKNGIYIINLTTIENSNITKRLIINNK